MGRNLAWKETFSGNLTCPGWQRPWKTLNIVPGLVSVPECTQPGSGPGLWFLVLVLALEVELEDEPAILPGAFLN